MRQAKIKSIEINTNDGYIDVTFPDNSGARFPSTEEMKLFAQSVESDPDVAFKLLLAWWLARDANMTNTNLVVGKTLTFDMTAQNMIRVQ